MNSSISFEDTDIAFSYKPNNALKKAHFIFSLISNPLISNLATRLVKIALKIGLPIKGIIRKTVFNHFCGGESIIETEQTIKQLAQFNVYTILDYSVEGEKSETGFNLTTDEILETLEKAHAFGHIPFSVFKVTGLSDASLLEKIQAEDSLSVNEEQAWQRVKKRVDKICKKAFDYNIRVLIDAEESWIQNPIDLLAYQMMARYNREKIIIYNTYQLYRTEGLVNLKDAVANAAEQNYFVGAKLVRGAYMEKVRDRAITLGYQNPIQPTKQATDDAFNQALHFCMANINRVAVMCGSHNEYSNMLLTELMKINKLPSNDKRIWFAQLYGMGDHISFNLAKAGYCVAKYVPYGPVKSVMPYLFRRAEENTSVAGQSSRELLLIKKELRRRRNIKGTKDE